MGNAWATEGAEIDRNATVADVAEIWSLSRESPWRPRLAETPLAYS
jgi:hypothetical protein